MILEVKDLNIYQGGERSINDLSFSVEEGEVLTVLGPNGAGKSTLLKALVGALEFEGSIEWKEGVKISYLPEDVSREDFVNLPLSVEDLFGLKDVSREEAISCLEDVGISSSFLGRSPKNLSSGEFSRVFLAWTLVQDPDVLLLDEPMEGIDAGGKETIYSLLHSFWEERGLTIILITHDLSIVYAHSDNVMCLRKRGLCYGAPKDVLTPEKLEEVYGHDIKFYGHQ